ncbi:winged helix-turn-helix transcriptional regulator [Alicyclobacillus mengziensis]|uniref:Winged helix-turn-helix transcriptional regulator n=2 Tax=Alicyclobacillus mengziensis TaxID=2931921 RepID=A0A9X7W3L2_9BACL|nr:winged helix-turn-helix transcriptional regulator [Alicyclobacillus mengziensis]
MCPKFKEAFDLLGKRWTGLILRTLCGGPKRFSEIAAIIPDMSERMLSERFRELECVGIVQRTVYPETPIRIEYDLTEKGKALHPVVEAVQTWADDWIN